MPSTNAPDNNHKHWSNRASPAPFKTNKRMGIRYIRNDIGVTLRKIGLFNFNLFADQDSSVKLVNISSRGALIATAIKLPVNKKVTLTIRFADFKEYEIPGKVVRRSQSTDFFYGVKFDKTNNKLADKLLATQRKLSFT